MSTQRHSVTPKIQRPFVWDAAKIRNLLDSLYQGYPVGYPVAWRTPTVSPKDGTSSGGKRILYGRRRDSNLRRVSGKAPEAHGAEDQDLVRGAVR